MPATLPSGNWHPLLWLGTLSNLACLHVGLGGGANESSSFSAKYPIKRLHTWHFCGAGLRSAAHKWVIQAPAGQHPVTREQQGWDPLTWDDCFQAFVPLSVQTGISRKDAFTLVPRDFCLEEPRKPSSAHQFHLCFPSRWSVAAPVCKPPVQGRRSFFP